MCREGSGVPQTLLNQPCLRSKRDPHPDPAPLGQTRPAHQGWTQPAGPRVLLYSAAMTSEAAGLAESICHTLLSAQSAEPTAPSTVQVPLGRATQSRAVPFHPSSLLPVPPPDLCSGTFPSLVTQEGILTFHQCQGKAQTPKIPSRFPLHLQLLIHSTAHSAVPLSEQMTGLIPQAFVTVFDNRLNTKRAAGIIWKKRKQLPGLNGSTVMLVPCRLQQRKTPLTYIQLAAF